MKKKSCIQKLKIDTNLQEMNKGFLVKTMDKHLMFNYYH